RVRAGAARASLVAGGGRGRVRAAGRGRSRGRRRVRERAGCFAAGGRRCYGRLGGPVAGVTSGNGGTDEGGQEEGLVLHVFVSARLRSARCARSVEGHFTCLGRASRLPRGRPRRCTTLQATQSRSSGEGDGNRRRARPLGAGALPAV